MARQRGRHRLKRHSYSIGYGRYVWYGHLWYWHGLWFENTVERGTVHRF